MTKDVHKGMTITIKKIKKKTLPRLKSLYLFPLDHTASIIKHRW